MENANLQVRIRMYRQGLGDCFLLSFLRTDHALYHMLIDCGVFKGTEQEDATMCKVAENIRSVTDGHLDLVVATHEHWDHLSGFVQAQDVFEDIEIDTLWCAWTEDPQNHRANELREEHDKLKRKFSLAFDLLQKCNGQTEQTLEAASVFSFFEDIAPGPGDGSNSTTAALDFLKRKAKKCVYHRPGTGPLGLDGVEGVQIFVLGPPEENELLKRDRPRKKSSEVYREFGQVIPTPDESPLVATILRADAPTDNDEVEKREEWSDLQELEEWSKPFDESQGMPVEAAKQTNEFFKEHYIKTEPWRRIDDDWLASFGSLALKLDNYTNNTSLVLAIELEESNKVLLFPGDAQVGNWLSWQQHKWSTQTREGVRKIIRSPDLLRKTVFYKVSHHGSHNATLRENGLELMTSPDLVAAIPVSEDMVTRRKWNMPFPPLLEALIEKAHGRVIQTDKNKDLPTKNGHKWRDFPHKPYEDPDKLYIDYVVE